MSSKYNCLCLDVDYPSPSMLMFGGGFGGTSQIMYFLSSHPCSSSPSPSQS